MHGRRRWRLLALCCLLLLPGPLRGQTAANRISPEADSANSKEAQAVSTLRRPVTTAPAGFNFTQLARAAGTIFSGTVTAIARRSASPSHPLETVAITFHVEEGLRGAAAGSDFTILQWIGVWSGGQRYRVGEHVLIFLYPSSHLGLTSSVAGPLGRFSVDGAGRVLLSAQHLSAFRSNPVLGGKSRATVSDFARAVQIAEER